jgi:hypothetical protein
LILLPYINYGYVACYFIYNVQSITNQEAVEKRHTLLGGYSNLWRTESSALSPLKENNLIARNVAALCVSSPISSVYSNNVAFLAIGRFKTNCTAFYCRSTSQSIIMKTATTGRFKKTPQANYTDRATAAFWRIYCQLLLIEGVA